jgi:hypothetical protein
LQSHVGVRVWVCGRLGVCMSVVAFFECREGVYIVFKLHRPFIGHTHSTKPGLLFMWAVRIPYQYFINNWLRSHHEWIIDCVPLNGCIIPVNTTTIIMRFCRLIFWWLLAQFFSLLCSYSDQRLEPKRVQHTHRDNSFLCISDQHDDESLICGRLDYRCWAECIVETYKC